MLTMTAHLLGGLGLFLIGMALLTEGLTALAGKALRVKLANTTRTRGRAVLSGAGVTAVVQSSSATTLATLGFVSAGLLSFEAAIGVIIGANIGTTSTGWIVSLLGIKFSIAKLALPLVGIGALMRLLGRGRRVQAGTAMAGFGMIFIGIDVLQTGMQALSAYADPANYPFEGFTGRLVLVGLGTVMTIIMQSSSAAVATTITALANGAINLEQAAALVVGQNVGTTATALIGAVGGSVPAKRTAVVHVVFNLSTGAIALLILPFFTYWVDRLMGQWAPGDHALSIAAFHTIFNLLGAAIFIPLTPQLARIAQRVVPEDEPSLTRHLHRGLLQIPDVAVNTVRDGLLQCAIRLIHITSARLLRSDADCSEESRAVADALRRISDFMGEAQIATEEQVMRRRVSVLHALDNLKVVLDELNEIAQLNHHESTQRVTDLIKRVASQLDQYRTDLEQSEDIEAAGAETIYSEFAEAAKQSRPELLAAMAAGQMRTTETLNDLAVQRWLERVLKHLWRALEHLEEAGDPEKSESQGESSSA